MSAEQVLTELKSLACSDKAARMRMYVQAVPGGYGEGDELLGCMVPQQRVVARQFYDLARPDLQKLFASPLHECRMTGMFILVDQYQRAAKRTNPDRISQCRDIVEFYLANLDALNNWDLVDSTAPKILGDWLVDRRPEREILFRLASSEVVWQRRVAIVATFALIRKGQFDETLMLAERLIDDDHDLIHKACGWMLREVGNRDAAELDGFLDRHARRMPRTMLRYSIEKLSPQERSKWMNQ